MGVDPTHRTWRSLEAGVHQRLMSQWDQTSAIMAAVYNAQRKSKRAPLVKPADLNPLRRRAGRGWGGGGGSTYPLTSDTIEMLKVFVER